MKRRNMLRKDKVNKKGHREGEGEDKRQKKEKKQDV